MLQNINNQHDAHHVRERSSSLNNLVAARNDGRKHLLLAYEQDLFMNFGFD